MGELSLENISKKLTIDVIYECFKVFTKCEDTIVSINVSRAAPAGEGLLSATYRVYVQGAKYETRFIAKGLVKDPLFRESIRCARYFRREIYFYTKILPLYVQLQTHLGSQENIQNDVPICFAYHEGDDEDFLVIEDITLKGFKCLSVNLTEFERDITLKSIAHLHSVSIALREIKPDAFFKIANNLPEVYFNEDNRLWSVQYLKNALAIDEENLREIVGVESVYYKKFIELTKTDIYRKQMSLTTYDGDYPILSHGDAWFPNFLCDKKKAIAIDFQLFRCSSLFTDITYFLTVASNLTNTKEKYLQAIRVYYEHLKYYLNDMGLITKLIKWDDLMKEMKSYGMYGLLGGLTTIPLLASERCDVLKSFTENYENVERIPLEDLWPLQPTENQEFKMIFVNAFRVAVDLGLI